MSNPYFNRATILRPVMFFGRTNLVERIYSAVSDRQSLSLVGSQRIGKSSLLRHIVRTEVQQQSKHDLSHHLFILIDLKEHLQKTSEDFFEFVVKYISEHYQESIDLLQLGKRGDERFSNLLTQLARRGFHTVLVMDGFDNVIRNKEFDPSFFSFLRTQAEWGKVSYITASIAPLHEICYDAMEGSPFFNIFSVHELGPLTAEEACALVTETANVAGCPFTETEIEWIFSLSGHHPFFIQRVCYFLFEEKCLKNRNEIDLNQLEKEIYNDLHPCFSNIWDWFSEQRREYFQREARQVIGQNKTISELSESRLFREFMHEKGITQSFQITPKELEQVLKKMNNPKALSESSLRYHKVVLERIKQISSPSSFDVAKAVREVLHEALESLAGSGLRRDTDPEWRKYNILFYRYFKHFIKNEPLAARLEFDSIRTYYRERAEAIKTLLNALAEMEAIFEDKDEH